MSAEESEEDAHSLRTEMRDILTLSSCTMLISELIKFILYRKRQLPYTFDRLKYLITKGDSVREKKTAPETSFVERQFQLAKEGLTSLELIFEKMQEQLASLQFGSHRVEEVALIFGSSPTNPKQVYRIHLPSIRFLHSSDNHPERKHLLHLLHSVITSKNFCAMLGKPMTLTNAFLFIKKTGTHREDSTYGSGFTPKNSFYIPQPANHFHIWFLEPQPTDCKCWNAYVYSDANSGDQQHSSTTWYQACSVFRGFADVYVDGVSVSDLWLR